MEKTADTIMQCLNLKTTDPFFNLATDEYLLKQNRKSYLILYVNDRCLVTGKHQIAHMEADTRFTAEHDIPVIRRISGGGTVFHDRGNLNFTFILNSESGRQVDFERYTLPVIRFLSSLGVNAKFEGRNDLKIGGLKISGNAEHVFRNRVLHHGTLLFDTSLELLKGSLRKDKGNYITRAVRSNPSTVVNLKDILRNAGNQFQSIYDFRSSMLQWMIKAFNGSEEIQLSGEESEKIRELADSKYRTWDWNYAYGPDYQYVNIFEFAGIECSCNISVRNGIIEECQIRGHQAFERVGKKFEGYRHMTEDMKEIIEKEGSLFSGFDIYNFF